MSTQTLNCVSDKTLVNADGRVYASNSDAVLDVADKQCKVCQEFWPNDSEFFPFHGNAASGLRNVCLACCEVKKQSTPVNSEVDHPKISPSVVAALTLAFSPLRRASAKDQR